MSITHRLALLALLAVGGCNTPTTTSDSGARADVPVPAVDAPSDAPSPSDVGTDAPTLADAPAPTDAPLDAPPAPSLDILLLGDLQPVTGFPATQFRAWLESYGEVATLAEPAIDDAVLAGVDLVVVGFLPRAMSGAERGALGIYLLNDDGRAIVLGGYTDDTRDRMQSVTAGLGISIDQTRTTFPTAPTAFVTGAVSQGSLTVPPPIAGAFTISTIGTGAALEVRTTEGDDVAARWESGASDGCAFVFTDDHPTLDVHWNADVAAFWTNVMGFLFPTP